MTADNAVSTLYTPWDSTRMTLFADVPDICHQHGYQLLRLTESSAVLRTCETLMRLNVHAVFAETRFRCEHHRPVHLDHLVVTRNATSTPMCWLQQRGLVLFQSIDSQSISGNFLRRLIIDITREVDQFSGVLKANGIWE